MLHFVHWVSLLNEKKDNTVKKLADIQKNSIKKIAQLQLDERFLEITNVAQLIIIEHNRLSKQILKSLENTITGKISPLVPLQTLTKDFEKLSRILSKNQKLPIDLSEEEILHIFKFSTTQAALIGSRVLVEISIEVVERDEYF